MPSGDDAVGGFGGGPELEAVFRRSVAEIQADGAGGQARQGIAARSRSWYKRKGDKGRLESKAEQCYREAASASGGGRSFGSRYTRFAQDDRG